MYAINATDVRRYWSAVMENAIREKPQFIKRTRDFLVLTDVKLMENLLSAYHFTAEKFTNQDGSVTLSLNDLELVGSAPTEAEARMILGKSILDYSEDFYNEYVLRSAAPNKKGQVPYVLKALIIDDAGKIGDSIECGKKKTNKESDQYIITNLK